MSKRTTKKLQTIKALNAAARSNRTADRAAQVVAGALFGKQRVERELDSMGREVRLTGERAEAKVGEFLRVTKAEIRHALMGNRVVTEDDMLYEVGPAIIRKLVAQGYIIEEKGAGYFWVTEKAAAHYSLGELRIQGALVPYRAAA